MKTAIAEDYEIIVPKEDALIPVEFSQTPEDLEIATDSREIREILSSFASEEEICFTYTRS